LPAGLIKDFPEPLGITLTPAALSLRFVFGLSHTLYTRSPIFPVYAPSGSSGKSRERNFSLPAVPDLAREGAGIDAPVGLNVHPSQRWISDLRRTHALARVCSRNFPSAFAHDYLFSRKPLVSLAIIEGHLSRVQRFNHSPTAPLCFRPTDSFRSALVCAILSPLAIRRASPSSLSALTTFLFLFKVCPYRGLNPHSHGRLLPGWQYLD